MTSAPHPDHQPEDLCSPGTALYERALRQGQVDAQEAAVAPCLVDFGLLHPSIVDASRLEPVSPVSALHQLLRDSAERIAEERRREERLTETFETLMRVEGPRTAGPDSSALRLLSGTRRINQAITETMAEASQEILCVQPHAGLLGRRVEAARAVSLVRDKALLARGGRIRTLYQHTLRHVPSVPAYHEQLTGDVQARSLDEVTSRLIVVDRRVAYIPANNDGTLALEVRHPTLVEFFTTTFERLWRLATPMFPLTVQQPSTDRVTPRQRAIAGLLVEGHTDAVIAERLGMNVRTAREHIAKLAATLGSGSRAQLGYLIGQSGILDPEP
ncbi:helix-turn-helix transcriptional regulator [Streptomyces sp. NPDC004069]